MTRLHQTILIASTLLGSWLAMQAVHELGHCVAAWVTGGRVAGVVLHPLTISRTDLSENPHPLAVVWAGPLLGVTAPLLLWGLAQAVRLPGAFILRFFAGFCSIANGAYIGIGSFDRIGDCGEMLRHGSQPWQLWLFGLMTIPVGFWLWHRQGKHFGFGPKRERISRGIAYASLTVCLLLLVLGFTVGGA